MKKLFICTIVIYIFLLHTGCQTQTAASETGNDSDSLASVAAWKLGAQLWTFHTFPFVTAIEKADSAGIKYIEAFPGQALGGIFQDTFGLNMSADSRARIKRLLQSKGMQLVAYGVVVPSSVEEWKRTFEFAHDMGIQYITAEPLKQHWDTINAMAGEYKILVAIHDHPRPSTYAHPDSVLAAIKGRINLGACADLGHWARNGLDVTQCLRTLEGRIIGVHLKDIATFNKIDAEDVILGTGVIKFPEVFSELKRQNFSGMFSIEHEANWDNNVPDVIRNRQFFEQSLKQIR